MLKYMGPLVAVEDIARTRCFYEQLLGQKVKYDFGVNVTFEGDFSLHLKSHLLSLMGGEASHPVIYPTHSVELTFETDDIAALCQRLRQAGVKFLHEIQKQPWGQGVMRVYDPDGYILEIGEAMDAVVRRYHDQGWSVDEITAKIGMPRDFAEQVLRAK